MNALEQRCVDLTNLQRSRGRLRPLAVDDRLSDAARRHSEDMLRRGFFAHTNPDRQTPADRVAAAVRRTARATAENIWMRSGQMSTAILSRVIDEAFAQLMTSRPHRSNIMDRDFTHLGVGVAVTASELRLTQLFAGFEE